MDRSLGEDRHWVVTAERELDLSSADRFRETLETALRATQGGLVIDFSGTHYIDSSGLRVIFSGYRVLRARGETLVLVTSDPFIRRLLSIVELDVAPGLVLCSDMKAAERLVAPGGALEEETC